MSLFVNCSKCGVVLTEPGGLMFSPPDEALVVKDHLCAECYGLVVAFIESAAAEATRAEAIAEERQRITTALDAAEVYVVDDGEYFHDWVVPSKAWRLILDSQVTNDAE